MKIIAYNNGARIHGGSYVEAQCEALLGEQLKRRA